jgi:RNA polymerase sigma factor (sigma-70 family)
VRLAGESAHCWHLDYEEAVSMAQARLVHAGARFDPTRGFAFTSYLYRTTRLAMMRLLEQKLARRRFSVIMFSVLDKSREGESFDPACSRREEQASLEVREPVERLARIFPQRSFRILWRYYGLNRKLKDTAEGVGLSKQRVGQLVEDAWKRAPEDAERRFRLNVPRDREETLSWSGGHAGRRPIHSKAPRSTATSSASVVIPLPSGVPCDALA